MMLAGNGGEGSVYRCALDTKFLAANNRWMDGDHHHCCNILVIKMCAMTFTFCLLGLHCFDDCAM